MAKQRFVLVPGENRFNRGQQLASEAFMARSTRLLRAKPTAAIPLGSGRRAQGKSIKVLAALDTEKGVDAMLVEVDDEQRLALHTRFPDLRLVQESTARMAFAREMLQPPSMAGMAGTALATKTISVRVVNPSGKPIARALVQLVIDDRTSPPIGMDGETDSKGELRLVIPKAISKAAYIRVEPQHTYWHAAILAPALGKKRSFELVCSKISLPFHDALSAFGGAGTATDGRGVNVAVIDGGAGPHDGIVIAGGRNFTIPEKPSSDVSDNGIGHGTHVAGIIAGRGSGRGIVGMAPGVTLRVYRVYPKNGVNAQGFAIAAAIKQAVDDGADLVNLSLTLDHEDLPITRQLQRARARGALCIAAAGNTGAAVMHPARHDAALAVSALGCRGCWPEDAGFALDARPKPKGKNARHFIAKFSCFGAEIDLSGPGVAIVSMFPRNRLAVLSGTSMAAPAVTGLLARALAKAPRILAAERNQARADAIFALARETATNRGFPSRFQGRGTLG